MRSAGLLGRRDVARLEGVQPARDGPLDPVEQLVEAHGAAVPGVREAARRPGARPSPRSTSANSSDTAPRRAGLPPMVAK